ncbi:glycosyltransferase family 4 protein [Microbacterium abyssi]|uniref:glycosyltransferase family 4 protein n=1 Tax=Microbacterium abyssi TaxID=2782166 RepID=UPI00188806A1|nr:glycosyltransferase family 1 protein [Microbacterium sp. A18JL241]
MTSLVVDNRWDGNHGIGRYAREVITRLSLPWTPLSAPGEPGSARDLLTPRTSPRDATIYSPGYNAGLAGARQIVTVHDLIHLTEARAKYDIYYRYVLRPAVTRARLVLTVSETSKRAVTEWLDDGRIQVVNAGNGASPAFTPGAPAGVPDYPYALYVGNLKPHKNAGVLLAALALTPELRLVAVTPNPDDFMRAAASARVPDRVVALHGLNDDQLCNLYRGALATALPSTLEGFGLPALESMLCGTPVIYWTGCESVAEIVQGQGLAVTDADDPSAWAGALVEIATIPSISSTTDLRARYSWSTVAETVSRTLNP